MLWVCSVSAQVLAIYCVERELRVAVGRRAAPAGDERTARRACCGALVAVQVMCGTSAALDARALSPGPLVVLSFAGFYALLWFGVRTPLGRAAAAADAARDAALAARLRRARLFFVVAWHGFPAVWAAGALGFVDAEGVRLGFVACDVLAKFLPASIYVSLAVSP